MPDYAFVENLADTVMDVAGKAESPVDGFYYEATHHEESFGVMYVDTPTTAYVPIMRRD